MSVPGTAEQREMDLVTFEIAVPRPRLVVAPPAAGGQAGPAAASRRRAGGAHSPAPAGPAPGGSPPGDRELHVRQVRVREVHVRELRTAERQEREPGAGLVRTREMRQVRRREMRSLTVHAGEPRPGGVRLTRRGRLVLAAFAVVVATTMVTLFWLGVAGGAQAASHGPRPGAAYRGMTRLVVRPGQTLWSIASRAEPTADPRLVIQQIMEVNALNGSVIQPGESLWVPKG